jgi:hypothetical protein
VTFSIPFELPGQTDFREEDGINQPLPSLNLKKKGSKYVAYPFSRRRFRRISLTSAKNQGSAVPTCCGCVTHGSYASLVLLRFHVTFKNSNGFLHPAYFPALVHHPSDCREVL